MLTVDANVFISAASLTDTFHAASDTFLSRVRHSTLPIHCPALILPETASGIIRPTGNAIAAQLTVIGVKSFPRMNLVTLTDWRAETAAQISITCRLRGADAIYVSLRYDIDYLGY